MAVVVAFVPAAYAQNRIVIVTEGDSLTYGQDTTSATKRPGINGAVQTRSVTPYPETLNRLLGPKYQVVNHGFPGDRTVDGLRRWPENQAGNVVVLMYGTNDALNFGGNPEGTITPAEFGKNLTKIINRRRQAKIVLIPPPPLQDEGLDSKLQPYRAAVQRIAKVRGIQTVVIPRMAGMWTDAVHLSPKANVWIARHVAQAIRPLSH